MRFAQQGRNGSAQILQGDILSLAGRLEEADHRCGGEAVGGNGKAVPDLGGATAVVPVGDAGEVEFPDEGP